MNRKILVLVALVNIINALLIRPVCAEDSSTVIENKPVTTGEVLVATFDEDGKLVPVGEPGTFVDGKLNIEIPETIPEYKPLVVMIQDPTGEGTPQMSFITDSEAEIKVDAAQTAIVNTFMGLASKVEDFDPKDVDIQQIKSFVEKLEPVLEDVPPAETTSDTVARMAQAMSLQPGAFMDAAGTFNADPEKIFEIAAMVDEAAGASFNPLEGLPELPNEVAVGSPTMGLIPADLMKKMPPGFKPEMLCADCPPPGGLVGDIPKGTFVMPPLQANSRVQFPPNVVMPQGVEIPKDFKMPAGAVLPPGVILAEGFVPPAGLKIPPGAIMPAGFDPSKFGAVQQTEFKAPDGFKPPPGFGLADSKGGFMLPDGFPIPSGTQLPDGAMAFPPPPGFVPPAAPPGSFKSDIAPPPQGFAFGDGFKAPAGFNPEAHGFVPPAGFVPQQVGPKQGDFSAFKGDNAQFFDPFGGKFVPPKEGDTVPFIPPSIQGNLPADFDPSKGFAPVAPPVTGDAGKPSDGGANKPPSGGSQPAQGGNTPAGGSQSVPSAPVQGGSVPNVPSGKDGAPPVIGDAGKPSDGGANKPPSGGSQPAQGGNTPAGGSQPAQGGNAPVGGSQPAQGGNAPVGGSQPAPSAPPPPPPPSGGEQAPPPPPSQRIKARTIRKAKTVNLLADATVTNKVGVRSVLSLDTVAKAKRLTASEGVYLIGKAKSSNTKALMTMIVDPSISSDSVKVSLGLTDNSVDTVAIDLENTATQLITQLDGKVIQVTTANSGITDIAASTVTGYLLPPGTSAYKMQSAIALKGTVTAGESGDIVEFTLPAKKVLASGVYTISFQDGDKVYYGKVTIGTLKARTISGKALAPNGKL